MMFGDASQARPKIPNPATVCEIELNQTVIVEEPKKLVNKERISVGLLNNEPSKLERFARRATERIS